MILGLAVNLSATILAIGIIISALEDWVNRKEYSDAGLMSWQIAELTWNRANNLLPAKFKRIVFQYESFILLIWVRVLVGLVVAVVPWIIQHPMPAFTAILLVALVVRLFRSGYGADGSDQMTILLLISLTLIPLFELNSLGQKVTLFFLVAQLTLAYAVAGIAKLSGSGWRDGTGLIGIANTYNYSWPNLSKFLKRHSWMALLSSWAIIIFETSFPVVWVLPRPGVVLFLGIGVAFHLGTALIMGLNNFLFAFLAAYPIAWYYFGL